MQYAGASACGISEAGGVLTAGNAAPARLHADQLYVFVVAEGMEQAVALLPPPTQAMQASGSRPT